MKEENKPLVIIPKVLQTAEVKEEIKPKVIVPKVNLLGNNNNSLPPMGGGNNLLGGLTKNTQLESIPKPESTPNKL